MVSKLIFPQRAPRNVRKPEKQLEVARWLKQYLSKGPKLATSVLAVGEDRGYSLRTLELAKIRANVESFQEGRIWYWRLRGTAASVKQTAEAPVEIETRVEKSASINEAIKEPVTDGLDRIDLSGREIKKPSAAVPLLADLTRAKFKAMKPAEIRILVRQIAAQGFDDRAIWRALNTLE